MNTKKFRYFVGDFETTVYKGQKFTEVWASAIVETGSEDVKIFQSIDETFEYLRKLKGNICVYYHNLKFDGNFWLYYLLVKLKLKQAYKRYGETEIEWIKDQNMPNNSFKYTISDKGQWYLILIKINNKIIEIRDSYKLLPFSVKRIGESFGTKHKKSEIEYTGYRYAGCEITAKEREYIANDVLVVKEAIEIMFEEGHNKLTIGSCCLSEYKRIIGKHSYDDLFSDLTQIRLNENSHKFKNADAWIRKSYKGGWCYLASGKETQLKKKGITLDVNSLYPSMMSSESGNVYPAGKPTFWKGDFIPEAALEDDKYYFVRIKTSFYIKDGYLPFIQIKGNYLYKGTECLKTSDIYNKEDGKYYAYYINDIGERVESRVELTLTKTDFILMREHYNLVNFEIIDGCYFSAKIGIFDEYIDKYKKIKLESKNAKRELAKLFLNNLYGKMSSSTDSSYKVAFEKDGGYIGFMSIASNNKKAGYIAVGSAITSYARNFTIRAAQANYYGEKERGFIYADTDSIHCDLTEQELKGVILDDKQFCCWKIESKWDEGFFTRQKTYIEKEGGEYIIKCAGMPQRCKELFLRSIQSRIKQINKYRTINMKYKRVRDEYLRFIMKRRSIEDFKEGLRIPGKLMPKRIPGGIVLVDTYYEMK